MADAFPNRATIEARQLAQLRALLAAILPANPFQNRRLAETNPLAPIDSLNEFTRRHQFTTKDDLVADQSAQPPYGSNLTFEFENYTRCHQTSGTRGIPLRWLDTPDDWQWMLGSWRQVYRSAGITAADRIYFAFSFGPFLGFWTAFEAAEQLGCLCLPGGGLSSVARLRAILDQQATVLCCTPTYAIHLAQTAAMEKVDLTKSAVQRIIVAGEPGGSVPATRRRIESLWPGARVSDHHGMTEVGPVSYECPANAGTLHIIESAYFAEVVNPTTGESIAPGETGELILTTLGRTGSPLLRYRTGDRVKPAASIPCSCRSHELALVGGILGRTDDMIIVRGVNIHPAAIDEMISHHGGVAEYQARLTTHAAMAELSLLIEPATGVDADSLKAEIERALQESFQLRIPVSITPAGSLPRFEMKAQRWVKE
ncbi:MAG: phenylacetate--CoA ligase family protein [Pedosphaera sp.]|nr:phenylacetate--CoA ligase family protein [Pedosphaera sp.]